MNNLEHTISQAFADCQPHPSSSGGLLTHQEAVEVRGDLWSLTDEDLGCWLPQILVDLLHHHSSDDLENTEELFAFLAVPGPVEVANWQTAEEREHTLKSSSYLRDYKFRLFGPLTVSQKSAIAAWLREAATWSGLSEFALQDIDSALRYWNSEPSDG